MKKTISIFLLSFYSLGTFCFPLGEFSFMKEIPEMYRNCKATEDKDMNALDFITDHLINIDGLFDHHDKGDEQKPHQPVQNQHQSSSNIYTVEYPELRIEPFVAFNSTFIFPENIFLVSDFNSEVFRPPVLFSV